MARTKRTAVVVAALAALAGYLYLSGQDYEMMLEDQRIGSEMMRVARMEQTADSLGLDGQDWLDFVNGED